jgi:predicted unusual protein kinase regulating ubiquinone biosynthesis (AarF/ABC1/UbiB family)
VLDGTLQKIMHPGDEQGADGERAPTAFARREAQRFVAELGRLKGTYVKIGQMLALFGEHFLPPVLTEALHELGSQTEPLPWEDMEPLFREALGPRYDELDIEEQAIAAASLAQVHRATVRDTGEVLVLKIQYPGLAQVIDADFDAVVRMLVLARWLQAGRELDEWLESMREQLHHEIDYGREAALHERMRELVDGMTLTGNARLDVPGLERRYCAETVLAMDYVDGLFVSDPRVQRLSLARRNALAEAMLELFFYELYDWGVLQTDPNFGNFLITPVSGDADVLVLLDFGSILDCDAEFLVHLRTAIAAGLAEDQPTLEEALVGLGCLDEDSSPEARDSFAAFCQALLEPLREPGRLPAEHLNRRGQYCWNSSRLMQRAGKRAARSLGSRHFATPSREFALIARKLTGVFTFIAVLNAEFNAHELVRAHIERWQKERADGS